MATRWTDTGRSELEVYIKFSISLRFSGISSLVLFICPRKDPDRSEYLLQRDMWMDAEPPVLPPDWLER